MEPTITTATTPAAGQAASFDIEYDGRDWTACAYAADGVLLKSQPFAVKSTAENQIWHWAREAGGTTGEVEYVPVYDRDFKMSNYRAGHGIIVVFGFDRYGSGRKKEWKPSFTWENPTSWDSSLYLASAEELALLLSAAVSDAKKQKPDRRLKFQSRIRRHYRMATRFNLQEVGRNVRVKYNAA